MEVGEQLAGCKVWDKLPAHEGADDGCSHYREKWLGIGMF